MDNLVQKLLYYHTRNYYIWVTVCITLLPLSVTLLLLIVGWDLVSSIARSLVGCIRDIDTGVTFSLSRSSFEKRKLHEERKNVRSNDY